MHISILQDQLQDALTAVGKVIDSRPSLPVLANVLLEASDAELHLTGTDIAATFRISIGAQIDEPGRITLPFKTFSELVKNLSPERVSLKLDAETQTVKLQCSSTRTQIKGINADEFPPIREAQRWPLDLPATALASTVKRTVFSAAKEDNRPILQSLHFELANGCLEVAAADGYRLAIISKPVETQHEAVLNIPAEYLKKFVALLPDTADPVLVGFDDEYVFFSIGSLTVGMLLYEGKFPFYQALIPASWTHKISMPVEDLLAACKRAEIFSRDSNYSTRLHARRSDSSHEPGTFQVRGASAERGDNEGMMDAMVEGPDLEVAVNGLYLIDILNVIQTVHVVIESNGPTHPLVIRPDDGSATYICMPMSINR